MLAAELEARLAEACAALERAGELLLRPSPENLDGCTAALAAAEAGLERCPAEGWRRHAGDASLLEQALRLRRVVRNTGHLLHTAAQHHRRWSQILRARLGGYTAMGRPAEMPGLARVSLQG